MVLMLRRSIHSATLRRRLFVFWDIDGTLFTSAGKEGARAQFSALTQVFGDRRYSHEGISLGGRCDPVIVREVVSRVGVSHDEFAEKEEEFVEAYAKNIATEFSRTPIEVTKCPGVDQLLRDLNRRSDIVLGLITGNYRYVADAKLRAIPVDPRMFKIGAFGDDSNSRNDLPNFALERARNHMRLGNVGLKVSTKSFVDSFSETVSPNECVVIGDTPDDIKCAHACGMRAISVATGLFSAAHLEEHSPNLLLDNFAGFTAEDLIDFSTDPATAQKVPERTSACGSSQCGCMSAQLDAS